MKLSQLVFFLVLLFSVNSWAAQELSKEEVAEVLLDSNSGNIKAQAYLGDMIKSAMFSNTI